MGKPGPVLLRDGIRELRAHGFCLIRMTGNHGIYKHPESGHVLRISHGHRNMDTNEAWQIERAIERVTQRKFRLRLHRNGKGRTP